jgi:oxygen-dependent protoporphyrinogen oxidase
VTNKRVVVIGGGVSGLAAAYFLSQRGLAPILLERGARTGGIIQTNQTPYGDLESGPDSFLATKPAVAELARELGLSRLLIGSNDEQRRVFIGHKGQLVPMPNGMVMMAPSDLSAAMKSPLFSAGTKARFLRETLRPPQQRAEDVTLERFVLDHFGPEVLDTIAEPLLTGVYGGDPAQLSVRSVLPRFLEYERTQGSLIRAVQKERRAAPPGSIFQSFANGMQTLTDGLRTALSGKAELRTGCEALTLERTPERLWSVRTTSGSVPADHVLIATPAHSAARLLQAEAPALAAVLSEIPYSSAILVTFVFNSNELRERLNGFGFLVPRSERNIVAAATFVGTKFPQRLEPGYVAIRSFIVGDRAIEMAAAGDDYVVANVRSDLARWTGIHDTPASILVHRWPNSMPQYVVGHAARVQAIEETVAGTAGLHLCGNSYTGVGIPDAIRTANAAAERILAV